MTLTELNDYLLVASNQYYIGDKDIEVSEPILNQLVKRALSAYGNYRPRWVQVDKIHLSTYENDFKTYDGRRVLDISNLYYYQPLLSGDEGKVQLEWDYTRDTGILRIQVGGTYYMELFTMPLLEDIDFDQFEFLDMMTGLYLQYVGSTRKGFTLGDLPFENDGDDLYQNGKELYETTLEKLGEVNSNWYLSIL